MKAEHAIGAFVTVLVAIAAVEAFYVHPTYGRGVRALVAVVNAALVL